MTTREPNGPTSPQDPTGSWASAPTSELPAHPAAPPVGQPTGAATAQPAGAASRQPAGAASPQPAAAPPGQPTQPPADPAAPPPGGHAAYATVGGGPGGGGPGGGGYGPPVAPHGAAPGGGRPGFWRRATSTTGGIVALVAAGVLVVLLVVGVAGAAAFAVGRGLTHHGGPGVSELREGRGNGMGPGLRGQGDRQRPLAPQQRGMGGMGGNGGGAGSLLGGAAGLGAVEHGEFTVTGSGGTPTVMTLQRGTVTAASATSLSVRSTDGFTATYALDSSTRTPARTVANGDSVIVVAQKQGSKAVLVRLTR